MAAFTTWAELKAQLLDDLSSGAWRTMASYSVAGRSVSYRSFAEFKALLDLVSDEASKEEGIASYIGRTYARQKGRA